MAEASGAQVQGGESLLYLTDEQLRQGIEAMFFAYRAFTADPDRILIGMSYGRAHHRAVHFINCAPGTTVNNLLNILGVTKQSLNRVLRTLVEDGLVESRVGRADKRERHLNLTREGEELERQLSDAQRARMRSAYRQVGPDAVAGFRKVLEAKAEGYRQLMEAAADNPQIAPTLLLIEQLPELVREQVKAISNLKIDKITVWDNGRAGSQVEGKAGAKGAERETFESAVALTRKALADFGDGEIADEIIDEFRRMDSRLLMLQAETDAREGLKRLRDEYAPGGKK